MVDFSKRLGKSRKGDPTDPVALYDTLDWASDKGPLRPAQREILTNWHKHHRQKRDLIIKLHTGQGKTLIGLLALLSKINENAGPSLYLCPNRFLAEQTVSQASQFGVPHCVYTDELPQEFLDGQCMLITHVQRLFNGQTRFGLGPRSIPVGSIVIDDAHACVDAIRDSSVIKLDRTDPAYTSILELFANALEHQGAGTFADIREGLHDTLLPVPYWAWQERQPELVEILAKVCKAPSDKRHKPHSAWYVWPLVRDDLSRCRCIVTGHSIEIAPYLPPLDRFGSFAGAKHRLFMSATVTNDSFLVKGLRLTPEVIRTPLVYQKEKWSGEKMILLPSLIGPSLDRLTVVNAFSKRVRGRKYGVVALTPSFKAADFWSKCGATVATSATIDREIEKLRLGDREATLALASRYDGIDLPDDSCRILIFDSMPYSSNAIDAYEESCRTSSRITAMRLARTIEQGLGRSVRGEKDYCVIVMTGPELIRTVRSTATRKLLSAQTQAQIDIGLQVASMARGESGPDEIGIDTIHGLVKQCLKRDANWKAFYIEQMNTVTTETADTDALDVMVQELAAEVAYHEGDASRARAIVQSLIDQKIKDPADKGWYLQEIARYVHSLSKTESNDYQVAAHKKNRYVMRPASGMVIDKISLVTQRRNENIIKWLKGFSTHEDLRLAVDAIVSDLEFGVKADRFEEAILQLGRALGFVSQRPEKEWREGPDDLWAVRDGEYFLIECKSEVDIRRAEIYKTETGQMNNACAWFARNYPGAAVVRIMIVPTKQVAKAAGFNEDVLVLRKRGLDRLLKSVRQFFSEFAGMDVRSLTEKKVQELIDAHELGIDAIQSHLERPNRNAVGS